VLEEKAYLVVGRRERSFQLQLDSAAKRRENSLQLDVGKLQQRTDESAQAPERIRNMTHAFTDTPMSTGPERLIRRLGTLGHTSVPVINLVALGILLRRQGGDTTRVVPSVRVPLFRVLPDQRVHLGDAGAGEDKVALGDDVGRVFGCFRRGEGVGDRDVGDDLKQ
jgi:hypothetical protein